MTSGQGRRPRGLQNDPLWYKDAIIYEVRTRSFFDSNGDGIGDLQGLTSKLDYLADLGVTAVWVLPHYPSPGRDDGYDCADYTDIHADVGTLEDFDAFVREAHKRGIRVITELVLNHTSDQHPWFQRARRAPVGSVERDFYVWNDHADRYKEARIIFRDFEPSNWAWDPVANAYYWHRFFAHQPDLNFENPAVHEAMFGVVDFWLARGVDALRLDAVPYLYEAEGTNCENLPATHAFLKKLRAHIDAKFPNRMLLAEANQWPEDAAAYFGDGDECHMNFHFPIMPRLFMSIQMEDRFPIIDILKQTPELHPSCQWAMFLRNHDELTLEMVTDEERDYMYRVYAHETQMRINLGIRRRLAPLVGNDRKKMELLNGLLFSMPGTPVVYYGDEIGMGDNVWLGDRNGVRTPMQWSADRNAGFSRVNPQRLILPINIEPEYHYEALNVEQQQSNPNSLLWWTKRLIAMRKRYRAFGRGSVEFLHPSNPRVLAFIRRYQEGDHEECVLVVANLSRHVQFVELDLSGMKGAIPVELMGRTRFPTVGELPYMLTLGGHDFYWFSLEASPEERRSLVGEVTLTCSSIDALLFGDERPLLEDALPAFLHARGLVQGAVTSARITETARLTDGEQPLTYVFVRVEYVDGEPESFALPLLVTAEAPPGASVVAALAFHDAQGAPAGTAVLVEATTEGAARVLADAAVRGLTFRTSQGMLAGGVVPGPAVDPDALREARVVDADRVGASIAYNNQAVLRLLYRVEEGTAPELEMARVFQSGGEDTPSLLQGITPRLLGYVERRATRQEPTTLALLEELVANEGTAWQHARSELGRMYERVTAHPADAPVPEVPTAPLVELSLLEPPAEHRDAIGAYRDWAMLLGRRVADLHRALASSSHPAFEPTPYSTMDQRSKYQTARNLIGRVLAGLRRTSSDLPQSSRAAAEQLVNAEDKVLARFEPILTHRIDARQIRIHGDLHLNRMLFTGKDFVIIGLGGGRERRLSERRRRRGALNDVAGILRSFHYAAATSLLGLRPEDQARAEPWGLIWESWASAAFLRGYLDTAKDAVFIPDDRMLEPLLDAAILGKAFMELRTELQRRPDMAWIPMQGILRLIGVEPRG
ncbi:MAG: maltose alpha-D-glucosyltransferase [Myxococcales bacterium 68-20]|nr:maltose alpha-D-glucosyltransferase [Myxococcales bacterium]OJY31081.1 MAG: maltose alpha-D-glucosyltransferase [Myxococcales bacterium 68-20]